MEHADLEQKRRFLGTAIIAMIVAIFLYHGATAPWYEVSPAASNASHAALEVNNVVINHNVTFSALDMARAQIALTTPAQGLWNPINLATSHAVSGVADGYPLALILAVVSLALCVLTAKRRSVFAAFASILLAFYALNQLAAFTQWARSPHFLYSKVVAGPGVHTFELGLWACMGLCVIEGSFVLFAKLAVLGEKYNVALHEGQHEVLAHSVFDRLGRAVSAFAHEEPKN